MPDFRATVPENGVTRRTGIEAGLGVDRCAGFAPQASWDRTIEAELFAICERYSGVQLFLADDLARIPASHPGGFDIALSSAGEGWMMAFGDWHDEFARADLALQYVELAVSGAIRLMIESSNGKPQRWTLQRRQPDGSWLSEAVMSRASLWPWGAKSVAYQQNEFARRRVETTQPA